jgi:hypothetical protein
VHHYPLIPVPVAVNLTFLLVALAAARAHHQSVGDDEIYKFPSAVGYLMLVCGLLFLCFPFLPMRHSANDMSPMLFFLFFATFATCAFAAAAYVCRFRVIVGDTTLTFGSFHREQIALSDVIDTDIVSGRSPELIVYVRGGRRVKFSGMLGDFADLADTVRVRCAGTPDGSSIEKLTDQRGRASVAQHLKWITGVGIALITVAALTTWLYER